MSGYGTCYVGAMAALKELIKRAMADGAVRAELDMTYIF